MKRAQRLLEHTNETIKVIAYSVGFQIHYISQAYKQFFIKHLVKLERNTLTPS